MSTAVVTGPSQRVADMALVLRLAGFEVYVPEPDVRQIPVEEVDCYVQFPDDGSPVGALTARFDAAARVAPKLASRATVVLVGDPPGANPAPDMRLVRLLMEAVIADHGGGPVRIAVVDGARPDDAVVAIAQTASPSF